MITYDLSLTHDSNLSQVSHSIFIENRTLDPEPQCDNEIHGEILNTVFKNAETELQTESQILLPERSQQTANKGDIVLYLTTARPRVTQLLIPEIFLCISKTVHHEIGKNPKHPRKIY